jgi:hypothetical protein
VTAVVEEVRHERYEAELARIANCRR